jgi:hypothetical protein
MLDIRLVHMLLNAYHVSIHMPSLTSLTGQHFSLNAVYPLELT